VGRNRRRDDLSRRIASEAARLAAASGDADLERARRKAAARLGARDPRTWPDLGAVDALLREHQRLFQAEPQAAALARLRRLATEAMRDLADFSPRLLGPVLDGTADVHSAIRLHLQAATPEAVIYALTDRRIPWRAAEVRLNYSRGRQQLRPCLKFRAGETPIELVVLSAADRDDPPLDPESGHPLRGADLDTVSALAAV
jgi:hypothetical protein